MALHLLPTELLTLIHALLPPSAQLTLSLACRRLHAIFFSPTPNPSPARVCDYALLRARELCGFKCHAFLTCAVCKESHSRLAFHPDALDAPPDARICVAHTPGLWVEPGKLFSYHQLYRAGTGYRPRTFDAARTPHSTLLEFDRHSMVRPSYALWTHHALLTVPIHKPIPKSQLARILHGLDLPACPHLRLNNPLLLTARCPLPTHTIDAPLAQSLPPLFDPADITARCPLPACLTSLRYTLHAHPSNPARKTLYLHVLRELGPLLPLPASHLDAAWCSQLIAADDAPALARHWERCMWWKDEMGNIDAKRHALEEREGDLDPAEKKAREKELQRAEEMVTEYFLRGSSRTVARPLFSPEQLEAFTNPQPRGQAAVEQGQGQGQIDMRAERQWLVNTFVAPVMEALSLR
ncbi:hypothetical protein FQN53_005032 [Emmonsiellopsis sp. PD_33]|nr:hypothetical protein FQN53_005032 [Emmonsiellopsis sp. PD_33]